MALTNCKECKHPISKSATACPNCGAKIKRTSILTKLLAGVFGLVLLSVVFRGGGGNAVPSASTATAPSQTTALAAPSPSNGQAATQTPEQIAEEKKRRAKEAEDRVEAAAAAQGLRWRYSEEAEKMGRGKVKQAAVDSLNEFQFDFPYRGAQRATLHLRIHPSYGKDVVLAVEKGQFLCGIDDCQVAVRFDDGKVQQFTAVEPADHSTTTLFLRNYDRFLGGLRKAKKVQIEASFFQQGTRVFEFDARDLKW